MRMKAAESTFVYMYKFIGFIRFDMIHNDTHLVVHGGSKVMRSRRAERFLLKSSSQHCRRVV